MTSVRRFSKSALRMRPAKVAITSGHVVRSNLPDPRGPERLSGYRMRPGSWIWLIVAGPLAQFRPLDPGWYGFPSSFWMRPSRLSMYATSPHAASQLKQMVGTSR